MLKILLRYKIFGRFKGFLKISQFCRPPKVTEDDLKQFKAPEFSQKDEGYDGRLVWDHEDEKSAEALLSFQIAVEGGDRDKIKELIGSITTIPEVIFSGRLTIRG